MDILIHINRGQQVDMRSGLYKAFRRYRLTTMQALSATYAPTTPTAESAPKVPMIALHEAVYHRGAPCDCDD